MPRLTGHGAADTCPHTLAMKAILLMCSAAILRVLAATAPAADSVPKALSKVETDFLDALVSVSIGMRVEEFYKIFPEAGVCSDKAGGPPSSYLGDDLPFPQITFAGQTLWGGAIFDLGRVQEVGAWTQLWSQYPGPEYLGKIADGPIVARHVMRKIALLVAAHFEKRFGKVAEQFIPGDPSYFPEENHFGLRHTWRTKGKAVVVEFTFDAPSTRSGISIQVVDWREWSKDQKQWYRNKWPLKTASRALLRRVIDPNDMLSDILVPGK